MTEGVNMLKHLNVFNQILDELYKVNVKVEDEDNAFFSSYLSS